MNLSKIRQVLDFVNKQNDFSECSAIMVTQVEMAYSNYADKDLGEFRAIIEDRLALAKARRAYAGY